MPSRPKNGLDDFFGVLRDVHRIALVAAGGLILLPLLAGLGGYVPPWPSGIVGITSLVELVVLITVFQLLSRAQRSRASRMILSSAILVLILSAIYLLTNAIFVYSIPNNSTRVVLGCGLSEKAKLILGGYGHLPTDVCPGEFTAMLASAQYETDVVWSKLSVSLIKGALAFSWLGAFGALAALVGVFVSFQRRQRPWTATRRT
ncbi:hypothetical protein SAMN05444165_7020 [Paraburkholderia phenazinium]|uniref:Uncharacterized protein n=1 Tax=Paraburkholderia phenazinium TaxID=60549 RepID=A0A1N6LF50_9BURK|nr:hypothetical protein SAMN05444165_7020 [Paraburkholderia phenazinium]